MSTDRFRATCRLRRLHNATFHGVNATKGRSVDSEKKAGRPSRWTKRQLIDGIPWRARVGSPWWDVPAQYGSWQAV
ncbi:transposase [Nocardia sp. NBC_00881]|uniref:transposase n=1 Tax=Nocardia sp. NBC_00881 TaxID=2975995 RepID=UPI0038694082|nr:transposase [Nocardia sp. NBC_00881]